MNTWSREIWRLLGYAAGGWLLGLVYGLPLWGLCAGLLGHSLWNLLNLRRLDRWLLAKPKEPPAEAKGVWGRVQRHLFTQRRRQRERSRKMRTLLRGIRETSAAVPDGVVILGQFGRIVWQNKAAAGLLGLKRRKDVGRSIAHLVRDPDFTHYLKKPERYEEGVEINSPRDDAVRLSIRLVPYGEGQRLLLIRDVTRLHRLEALRKDFVANVSHELRTPLTVVLGYLETLVDFGSELSAEQLDDLHRRLQNQSARMQRIVDDLLMLSRIEGQQSKGSNDVVDMPAVISAAVEDARSLSGERQHRIEAEVDAGLFLLGEEQQLRSVVSNLLGNAVRYTPAGGTITVRWYASGKSAHLSVQDNGDGIPAKSLPRLTERFYRVDTARSRHTGGTGLGLAIVKHALNFHHARLHVDSRVGEGSLFRCDFPKSIVHHTDDAQTDAAQKVTEELPD
ncbi:MAG: phosphate regulon sensor histidine kinase PhoR [Chromatiales bacterium]|nr:phosphate regulon sensor histidine kinase PhoR [Chromatiales bacterium]